MIDLDWAVPNFSTLSRRQKTLKVNIPYRGSPGPLHLLIDIEPVSATGSSEPARDAAGTSGPDPARSGDRQCHRPLLWFDCKPQEGPPVVLLRSSRPARTPNPGNPTPLGRAPRSLNRWRSVPRRATRPCARRNASAGRSGDDGEALPATGSRAAPNAISARAASKRRCDFRQTA